MLWHYEGGANNLSLHEAQRSFSATEVAIQADVRGVLPADTRDPAWRLIAESHR
jgi:hypothetical protein